MALSILSRYSRSKTTTSTSNSDDNKKSRRSIFRSASSSSSSSSTSVEFINEVGSILASFHDLVVGILLIAFALPFFYVVGVWIGTNITFSTEVALKQMKQIYLEHATMDFTLQNHRIKDEPAPCGAHKVRVCSSSIYQYQLDITLSHIYSYFLF